MCLCFLMLFQAHIRLKRLICTSSMLLMLYFHLTNQRSHVRNSKLQSISQSSYEDLMNLPLPGISVDWNIRPKLSVGAVFHHAVYRLQQIHHRQVLESPQNNIAVFWLDQDNSPVPIHLHNNNLYFELQSACIYVISVIIYLSREVL